MAIGTFRVSDSKRLGSPSSGLDLIQLKSDAGYEALTFRTKGAPAVDVILPVEAEFEPLGATSGGRIEKAQKIEISRDGPAYSQETETSLNWTRAKEGENSLFYISHVEPASFGAEPGIALDGFEYSQKARSGEKTTETEVSFGLGYRTVDLSGGGRRVLAPKADGNIGLVIVRRLTKGAGEDAHTLAMAKVYLPEEGELNHVNVYGDFDSLSSLLGDQTTRELDEKYSMWGGPGILEMKILPEKVRSWAKRQRLSAPTYFQTPGYAPKAEGLAEAVLGLDASSVSFAKVAEGIGKRALSGDSSPYSLPGQ